MTLPDLADAARRSGLTVIELPGWQSNGRSGSFAPRGVLVHHTGSYDTIGDTSNDLSYARWLAFTGRPDLPAPLCQLALSAEGVVYVCAGGRANHGGKARASGPMPAGDANALYVGIEAMNSGTQGWATRGRDAAGEPVTQYDAYVRLVAALCVHYGWPATHVRAHRETSTTGKWDPGGIDMTVMRADVARTITQMEDWLTMATEAEVRAIVRDEIEKSNARLFAALSPDVIADAVWTRDILTGDKPAEPGGKAPTKRAGVMLRQIWRNRKSGIPVPVAPSPPTAPTSRARSSR